APAVEARAPPTSQSHTEGTLLWSAASDSTTHFLVFRAGQSLAMPLLSNRLSSAASRARPAPPEENPEPQNRSRTQKIAADSSRRFGNTWLLSPTIGFAPPHLRIRLSEVSPYRKPIPQD